MLSDDGTQPATVRNSKPAWRWRLLIIAGTTALAAVAAAVLSVRLFWGYWFVPPKVEDLVSDVVAVHAFSTFHFDESVSSGERALARAAKTADWGLGEDPSGRIPAELQRLGLVPRTQENVEPWMLEGFTRLLKEQASMVRGDPGYDRASVLRGHLALVTTRGNERLLVTSVTGGEFSNDTYAFYAARVKLDQDRPQSIVGLVQFNFDVAGLEGLLLPSFMGVYGALVSICFWLMFGLVEWAVGRRRRAT